jgi:hypothetical protein
MTETYIIYDKEDCIDFFKLFQINEYKEKRDKNNFVFMEKIGSGPGAHGALGVRPFDKEREKLLVKKYKGGKLCGKLPDNIVMQEYVARPLLLDGHKFDIRVHLLVPSVDPLIAYYSDGYFRVSLMEFDPDSDDSSVFLSNNHDQRPKGMSKAEEDRLRSHTLESLGQYLVEKGRITDASWIENSLRLRMKQAMIHLLNATKSNFAKTPGFYEHFGLDFLLDEDLNIWFMECQIDPGYTRPGTIKEKPITRVLLDHWEITFGFLRSRMKRVMLFVNELSKDLENKNWKSDAFVEEYLKDKHAQYKNINSKQYLDREFAPKHTNKYVKIFDESLTGKARYGGVITDECLNV